eukprot:TRINITY_DN4861_c0_g1_i4.p1 TRINITY_DN4861_c0_g1~~TRINITY_DN4861_c0_g1_i4.p1  ORF type:complete len:778 (+),score=152.22 TRINITY_DN4861_c0_g1_i4:30-2363(+)
MDQLPDEILVLLLHHVPSDDVMNIIALISRSMMEVSRDNGLWKYKARIDFSLEYTFFTKQEEDFDWRREYLALEGERRRACLMGMRTRDGTNACVERHGATFTGVSARQIHQAGDNNVHDRVRGDRFMAGPERDTMRRLINESIYEAGVPSPSYAILHGSRPLHPLPYGSLAIGYFEVTVCSIGGDAPLAVGLSPRDFHDPSPLGHTRGTIAVHSTDGGVYVGQVFGRAQGTPWGMGDVVGCGIDFNAGMVFFTENGMLTGYHNLPLAANLLHASIALPNPGDQVSVNFGSSPFQFHLSELHGHIIAHRGRSSSSPREVLAGYIPKEICLPWHVIRAHAEVGYSTDQTLEHQTFYLRKCESALLDVVAFPNHDRVFMSRLNRLLYQAQHPPFPLPPVYTTRTDTCTPPYPRLVQQTALETVIPRQEVIVTDVDDDEDNDEDEEEGPQFVLDDVRPGMAEQSIVSCVRLTLAHMRAAPENKISTARVLAEGGLWDRCRLHMLEHFCLLAGDALLPNPFVRRALRRSRDVIRLSGIHLDPDTDDMEYTNAHRQHATQTLFHLIRAIDTQVALLRASCARNTMLSHGLTPLHPEHTYVITEPILNLVLKIVENANLSPSTPAPTSASPSTPRLAPVAPPSPSPTVSEHQRLAAEVAELETAIQQLEDHNMQSTSEVIVGLIESWYRRLSYSVDGAMNLPLERKNLIIMLRQRSAAASEAYLRLSSEQTKQRWSSPRAPRASPEQKQASIPSPTPSLMWPAAGVAVAVGVAMAAFIYRRLQ